MKREALCKVDAFVAFETNWSNTCKSFSHCRGRFWPLQFGHKHLRLYKHSWTHSLSKYTTFNNMCEDHRATHGDWNVSSVCTTSLQKLRVTKIPFTLLNQSGKYLTQTLASVGLLLLLLFHLFTFCFDWNNYLSQSCHLVDQIVGTKKNKAHV